MADVIQLRRDMEISWTAANPVLAQGEIGIVIDLAPFKLKIGDGETAWNDLVYFAGGTASSLADLADVDVSTVPAGGQSLVYDAAAVKWKPGTITGGGTGIANLAVDASGDLIVTLTDSTVINAGYVVGEQGPQGATGPAGAQGLQGIPGAVGKSAYQVWLDAGNSGTEADFLASLKGETGPEGPAGADGSGAGDMTKAVYDTNNSGKVDAAEVADSVAYIDLTTAPVAGDILVWDNMDSKFKPSDILSGLEAALAAINGV